MNSLKNYFVQRTQLQTCLQIWIQLNPLVLTRMLKCCAYTVAPSLTKLFNVSLSSGIFPHEWKIARIPKTDHPSSYAPDYRPISILPILSNILERHVKQFIEKYIADNAQNANGVSCITDLHHLTGFVLWMQVKKYVLYFSTLGKRLILCPTLLSFKSYGILDYIHIFSELFNWKRTIYCGQWMFIKLTSSLVWCSSRISSRSSIYINDVVNQILPDSNINLFADDIALIELLMLQRTYMYSVWLITTYSDKS